MRAQEEQADRAGVKFLAASGQSAKGMYDTFKRMSEEALFAARNADPYLQSHPLPAERVRALEEIARSSPNWDKKDSPELQMRHDLMRAKLFGFLDRGDAVARRYPISDQSLPAKYARAIATFRHADLRAAISQIDALITAQPNNPYFHELKGQAFLEGGKPDEAIAPLHRSGQLAAEAGTDPDACWRRRSARKNDPESADEAVTLLRTRARAGAGVGRRLCPARHGPRPQGRPRPGRPRLGDGGLHARRRLDRPPTRRPCQDPLSDRLARLAEGRRYRRHRQTQPGRRTSLDP